MKYVYHFHVMKYENVEGGFQVTQVDGLIARHKPVTTMEDYTSIKEQIYTSYPSVKGCPITSLTLLNVEMEVS